MATTKMQHITINNEISITTVCLDDHEAPIATPKETRKDGTLLDESPTHSVQEEAPPPATSRRMKQWLNSKASGAKSSISEDNSDTSSRSRSRSRAGSKNSGEEQRVVATTSAGGFSFGSFKANYNSMNNNNNNNNNSQPCVPPRRRISVPLIEQDIKDLSLQETDNQGSPTTSERSSPWSWAPSSTLSLSSTFGSLQQSRKSAISQRLEMREKKMEELVGNDSFSETSPVLEIKRGNVAGSIPRSGSLQYQSTTAAG